MLRPKQRHTQRRCVVRQHVPRATSPAATWLVAHYGRAPLLSRVAACRAPGAAARSVPRAALRATAERATPVTSRVQRAAPHRAMEGVLREDNAHFDWLGDTFRGACAARRACGT